MTATTTLLAPQQRPADRHRWACLALWRQGGMTTGEASAGLALVLRLIAMSGWVMQTVRGVFENVGVIQESMQTISRPHGLVDAPGARELAVTGGEIRYEQVGFHYGAATPRSSRISPDDPGRRARRAGGGERRGQVDPRDPAAAPLRRGERAHPHRRAGHRGGHAIVPARGGGDGEPGHVPAAPLHPGQHRLRRPSATDAEGRSGRPLAHADGFHRRPRGSQGPAGATRPMWASGG